jgi:hypothetical protein
MSDMLIPLVVMLIILILIWIVDSVYIYPLLALVSTDITIDIINSGNNFFTIPIQMYTTFALLWIFITLTTWAQTYRMTKKARERYNKALNVEE